VAPFLDSFQRLVDAHVRLPGFRLTSATLLSTYRVNVRMVDRYRVGRVFLAGDAAHVHSIAGGMGMNTGIQDAANLGWKLGMVVCGKAGAGLLDTYEEGRRPVAEWTLAMTSARQRAVLEAIRSGSSTCSPGRISPSSGSGRGRRRRCAGSTSHAATPYASVRSMRATPGSSKTVGTRDSRTASRVMRSCWSVPTTTSR